MAHRTTGSGESRCARRLPARFCDEISGLILLVRGPWGKKRCTKVVPESPFRDESSRFARAPFSILPSPYRRPRHSSLGCRPRCRRLDSWASLQRHRGVSPPGYATPCIAPPTAALRPPAAQQLRATASHESRADAARSPPNVRMVSRGCDRRHPNAGIQALAHRRARPSSRSDTFARPCLT
jgi:hypothetical protein